MPRMSGKNVEVVETGKTRKKGKTLKVAQHALIIRARRAKPLKVTKQVSSEVKVEKAKKVKLAK